MSAGLDVVENHVISDTSAAVSNDGAVQEEAVQTPTTEVKVTPASSTAGSPTKAKKVNGSTPSKGVAAKPAAGSRLAKATTGKSAATATGVTDAEKKSRLTRVESRGAVKIER